MAGLVWSQICDKNNENFLLMYFTFTIFLHHSYSKNPSKGISWFLALVGSWGCHCDVWHALLKVIDIISCLNNVIQLGFRYADGLRKNYWKVVENFVCDVSLKFFERLLVFYHENKFLGWKFLYCCVYHTSIPTRGQRKPSTVCLALLFCMHIVLYFEFFLWLHIYI